jgi:hypothetical protein
MKTAEITDLWAQVRHLEGVLGKRDAREGDVVLVNKMLHQEISRLQARVVALESELAWRDADA